MTNQATINAVSHDASMLVATTGRRERNPGIIEWSVARGMNVAWLSDRIRIIANAPPDPLTSITTISSKEIEAEEFGIIFSGAALSDDTNLEQDLYGLTTKIEELQERINVVNDYYLHKVAQAIEDSNAVDVLSNLDKQGPTQISEICSNAAVDKCASLLRLASAQLCEIDGDNIGITPYGRALLDTLSINER